MKARVYSKNLVVVVVPRVTDRTAVLLSGRWRAADDKADDKADAIRRPTPQLG